VHKGLEVKQYLITAKRARMADSTGSVPTWPLQDIVSFQSFMVGVGLTPPAAKLTLLQYYCRTIAQYTPPDRLPLVMPYTIHYW